jgi:hypothetical protein
MHAARLLRKRLQTVVARPATVAAFLAMRPIEDPARRPSRAAAPPSATPLADLESPTNRPGAPNQFRTLAHRSPRHSPHRRGSPACKAPSWPRQPAPSACRARPWARPPMRPIEDPAWRPSRPAAPPSATPSARRPGVPDQPTGSPRPITGKPSVVCPHCKAATRRTATRATVGRRTPPAVLDGPESAIRASTGRREPAPAAVTRAWQGLLRLSLPPAT